MSKKLSTISLSGLMIGPILGSGIVLLPPMAIEILGDKAIIAWIAIMLLGSVFAYVFAKLSLLAPNNEGVSVIVGEKLGQSFRELSSNYLTAAVCFGPVAVLYTASGFVSSMFPGKTAHQTLITFVLLLLSALVLVMGITAIGKLTLLLSSLTALVLVISSIYSLFSQAAIHFPSGLPGLGELGSTLLLLFWAIIGWEVIGNYVEEVSNPQLTIMRAMKISLCAVVLIYLLSTFALQNGISQNTSVDRTDINMTLVLIPLFGSLSYVVMGIIATGLCFCTLIMILGAVTRQIAARAEYGQMPAFFKQRQGERSPKRALFALTFIHCAIITLIHFDFITLHWVVGIANTFFICNALLGLIASLRCVKGYWLKSSIILLILSLCILLVYSPLSGWVLLVLVSLLNLYRKISSGTATARTTS